MARQGFPFSCACCSVHSPCGQKSSVLVVVVAGETVCGNEGQAVEPQVRAVREQTAAKSMSAVPHNDVNTQ